LEEQNRELEEKRSLTNSKMQEEIDCLTSQLRTSTMSFRKKKEVGVELQSRVEILQAELSQSKERTARWRIKSESELERLRSELETKKKEMAQLVSKRERDKTEIERWVFFSFFYSIYS
jgi:predicted  nucleic acid-binding Zn-ribbon protein